MQKRMLSEDSNASSSSSSFNYDDSDDAADLDLSMLSIEDHSNANNNAQNTPIALTTNTPGTFAISASSAARISEEDVNSNIFADEELDSFNLNFLFGNDDF